MLSYHTCPLATLGGKDTGGMNVYVRDLTRTLGAMGIHVDVFTRSQDEHVPHVLHDLGYGNRVVHVPAGPEHPLPKPDLVRYLPQFVEGIIEFSNLKNLGYDLIHSHYWLSGLAAREMKFHWELPVVHMFHTLGIMKDRVARAGEVEGEYRIEGERSILGVADRVIASTQAEATQLAWLYKADRNKIVVIPPGVDVSHFYPIPEDEAKSFVGVPQNDLMLLFVGRIEPIKGVDTLFQALVKLRDASILEQNCICLSIIGGEPYPDDLAKNAELARLYALRKEYGLEKMVTFLGHRGQDALPYYYSSAAVVVMPSRYESFGMVALESMACGTPVVASHVGGLGFLIEDGETGFLVPDGDPEALFQRLLDLIEQPELREAMGQRAAEYAKQYAWALIAPQILDLYKVVLLETSR